MSAEGWISLGLSMFCAVLTACVGPEWIKAAGELDVLAMASWTATFAFAGIFVGIGIGRIISGAKHEHAPSYFERHRMEREERERAEREERERKIRRDWAMGLDANLKAMLLEISEAGSADIPFDSKRDMMNLSRDLSIMGEPLVSCTSVGYEDDQPVYRVRVNELGKKVLDECRDTLAEVDEFEESKRKAGAGSVA